MKQKSYTPDSRFKGMGAEAKAVSIGWGIYFALILIVGYFFGSGDPAEYTYLFGFPLWFTLVLIINLVFLLVSIFIMKFKMKEFSLEPDDPSYNYNSKEGTK